MSQLPKNFVVVCRDTEDFCAPAQTRYPTMEFQTRDAAIKQATRLSKTWRMPNRSYAVLEKVFEAACT